MNYFIGVLSVVFWSGAFVYSKKLMPYMTPYEIVFYRYFIAGVFFYIILKITKGKSLEGKKLGTLILASVLGIFLYPLLSCVSLKYISASMAGILNGSIPLITLVFEKFIYKRKLSLKMILALLLSIVGILISTSFASGSNSSFFGVGIMLISLICWVVFAYVNDSLFEQYTGLELICYESIIGSIIILPTIINSVSDFERQVSFVSNSDVIINLLLLAIVISSFGYLCYMYGLKKLGVPFMSFLMNLFPLMSVLSAYLILGEKITVRVAMGLVIIIFSVVLANDRGKSGNISKNEEKNKIELEFVKK